MGEPPFSTDSNLLHTSSEGKLLEDPWTEVPNYVYTRTNDLINTPNEPEIFALNLKNGDPIN